MIIIDVVLKKEIGKLICVLCIGGVGGVILAGKVGL